MVGDRAEQARELLAYTHARWSYLLTHVDTPLADALPELSRLGLRARPVPGGAEAEGEDAAALACLAPRAAVEVSLRLYQGPSSGLVFRK